ncbi:hypothetical protein [Methylibium petroleiphilum]|uniref:hypothetical protein n=1 Tax=Methylibium petroleiphilum TaxID=105560 RepID=UPI00003CD1DC|nr:hypothetical protein [Methylibium petroleiphilum]
MKRSVTELSVDQLEGLLALYAALTPDGRSTPESLAARRAAFDTQMAKRRTELGLVEKESDELSVLLELNRRMHWTSIQAQQRMAAAAQPSARPAAEPISDNLPAQAQA